MMARAVVGAAALPSLLADPGGGGGAEEASIKSAGGTVASSIHRRGRAGSDGGGQGLGTPTACSCTGEQAHVGGIQKPPLTDVCLRDYRASCLSRLTNRKHTQARAHTRMFRKTHLRMCTHNHTHVHAHKIKPSRALQKILHPKSSVLTAKTEVKALGRDFLTEKTRVCQSVGFVLHYKSRVSELRVQEDKQGPRRSKTRL